MNRIKTVYFDNNKQNTGFEIVLACYMLKMMPVQLEKVHCTSMAWLEGLPLENLFSLKNKKQKHVGMDLSKGQTEDVRS